MIRRLVWCSSAFTSLVACSPAAVPNASDAIALVGATVINLDGRAPIANATVLISGRRIANVGTAGETRVPERATRIDLSGAYIIPGLWDMHTHLSKTRASALSVLLAYGVTSVRDMGGEMDELLRWRDEIRAGDRIGPRMLIAGPYLESPANVQRQRSTPAAEMAEPVERTRIPIASRADAERVIDSIKSRGVNHVKIRTVASLPVYQAIAAVAKERGLPLVGHADAFPFREVVLSGQRSVEHLSLPRMEGLSPNERAALFAQYARQGSALVPTLVTAYGSLLLEPSVQRRLFDAATSTGNPHRPRISKFLEIDWREQLSERDSSTRTYFLRLVPPIIGRLREMRAAGVPLMTGTDIGVLPLYPGESLHDELDLFVRQLAMTPLEAISAATRVPAAFVGVADSVGTIAPGKIADLVVLDADPLADINNVRRVRGVMLGGRWFDRAALDALLASAARAEDVQRNDWIR